MELGKMKQLLMLTIIIMLYGTSINLEAGFDKRFCKQCHNPIPIKRPGKVRTHERKR